MKIFLDVDGVLIDGWHADPSRRKAWDATIERDLGIDRAHFQNAFFRTPTDAAPSLMYECLAGKRDLKSALQSVLPDAGYSGSVDRFVTYWFENDSNINTAVLNIAKRLAQFSELQLYIATGQEHYRAAYLWHTLGFKAHFAGIFYSAKIGHLKNTAAYFDAINLSLSITGNDRPLFFDDTQEIVDQARSSGWDACLFRTTDDMVHHPRLEPYLHQ